MDMASTKEAIGVLLDSAEEEREILENQIVRLEARLTEQGVNTLDLQRRLHPRDGEFAAERVGLQASLAEALAEAGNAREDASFAWGTVQVWYDRHTVSQASLKALELEHSELVNLVVELLETPANAIEEILDDLTEWVEENE